MIVGAETEAEVQGVYAHLKKFFKLTDFVDMLLYFLGLKIQQQQFIAERIHRETCGKVW